MLRQIPDLRARRISIQAGQIFACEVSVIFVTFSFDGLMQAWGVILGIANEAGAHWDKLAQGICLWEARALISTLPHWAHTMTFTSSQC